MVRTAKGFDNLQNTKQQVGKFNRDKCKIQYTGTPNQQYYNNINIKKLLLSIVCQVCC